MSSPEPEIFSVRFFSNWHLHVTIQGGWIFAAKWLRCAAANPQSDLAQQIARWLRDYFAGAVRKHGFSLHLTGSHFRHSVYSALRQSRYGETMTYAELAYRAGYPRAQRAVGTAMRCNKLPVFLPCHRVVGTQGIGGYTPSLEIKKELLSLEAKNFC